jgi:hypothetical protein
VRWQRCLDTLLMTSFVRQATDTIFLSRARQHLVEFDHQTPGRSQEQILRGLIHRASGTRFGRAHDFRRISSHGDYKRLVPLRLISEFRGPRQALPSALLASHRRAATTTLAMVLSTRPRARPFSGQLLVLGEAGQDAGAPGCVPGPNGALLQLPRTLRP